jgi:putative membrane protein
MKGLFVRWIVSGLSLLLAGYLVPGIEVQSVGYALLAAAFLGILNAVVRPVLILLTLPLTVLTLGLFIFVVNGLMLWLLSGIIKGIYIDSFGSAMLGALILSIISFLINSFTYRGGEFREWTITNFVAVRMDAGPDL